MAGNPLECLLDPQSLVLVGASARPGSIGQVVLENVLSGGFHRPVYAVNPHPVAAPGCDWIASIADLPGKPQLAIVLSPPASIPGTISALGEHGVEAAVVITAGIAADDREAMLAAARATSMRIVGPNCVGMLMPHARLNASFSPKGAMPGRLALISQSGALVTAMIDWANARRIGFSGIMSVGDMADVDLADLIGMFASDPKTDAILIYVEGVTNAQRFMSAASAAAESKPIIAIKAGRSAAAGRAAMSHTGALTGAYDVYRAAFRQAGIILVETLTELFDAAEMLCKVRTTGGNRLAIVTNGGGAGVLAIDALDRSDGTPADLSASTVATLDSQLPPNWSRGNPVDIIGDARADRYASTIAAVLPDDAVDALLVINCPTAITPPVETATAVADAVRNAATGKPVLACWLGDSNCAAARPIFAEASIPVFPTPEDAVRGFGYLLAAARSKPRPQPNEVSMAPVTDRRRIDALLQSVHADGRTLLNEVEAKALLAASGISVVPTRLVRTIGEVGEACATIAAPYAVKIVSPDITHKSDVGGVALHLVDTEAAMTAAANMLQRIESLRPQAKLAGFAIESMIVRSNAHELIVGISNDPTFGPIVMVGAGGKAVEILRDRALGLPPLDDDQIRRMIGETRIAHLLAGYRDEPAADIGALVKVVRAVSALATGYPDIVELDINPLLVDPTGAIALDARVRITSAANSTSRLVLATD